MTIFFEEEYKYQFEFDSKKLAEDVINAAIEYMEFPFEAEVSVTITDLDGIHAINKEFRDIDRPTDVLSFPMIEYKEAGFFDDLEEQDELFNPESGEIMLGDIVLCVPKIIEQASEYGHSQKREYAFLIAHSMLHLFGFDHLTESEASVMEKKQEEILALLNITRD